MANWGEFLKEFKIKNLKSDGIWVKVDEVLDLYDERQRLRDELAQLKQELEHGGGGQAGNVGEIREQCARELEEVAEVALHDPDQPEYIATVLQAAAGLLRGNQVPMAAEDSEAESVPEGVPVAEPAGYVDPAAMAEPVVPEEGSYSGVVDSTAEYLKSIEIPPPAEPAEPASPSEEHGHHG
jgi:hypothetical protein